MGFAFTFGGGNAQQTGNSASMRALGQLGMEERRMRARQEEVGFNQDLATKKFDLTAESQGVEMRLQEQAMAGEALRQTQSKQEAKDAWELKKAQSAANLGIMTQQETMAPMTPEMASLAGATKTLATRFPAGSSAQAEVYAAGAEQLGLMRVKQHFDVAAGSAERGLREMQIGMAEDGMDEDETALVKRLGEGLQQAKQIGDLDAVKVIDVEVFNAKQAIARTREKAANWQAAKAVIAAQIDTFLQSAAVTNTMEFTRGVWMRAEAARAIQARHSMLLYDDDFVPMAEVADAIYGRDKGRNLEDPSELIGQAASDELMGSSGQARQLLAGFREQAQQGTFDPTQAAEEVDALPVSDEEKNRIFDAMLADPAIQAVKARADQGKAAAADKKAEFKAGSAARNEAEQKAQRVMAGNRIG